MREAGVSDHWPIRLATVCCVNLFSRRSFIVLVLSVQLRSGRILDERLLAHPQRDLRREKPALYPRATWRLRLLTGNKEEDSANYAATELSLSAVHTNPCHP